MTPVIKLGLTMLPLTVRLPETEAEFKLTKSLKAAGTLTLNTYCDRIVSSPKIWAELIGPAFAG